MLARVVALCERHSAKSIHRFPKRTTVTLAKHFAHWHLCVHDYRGQREHWYFLTFAMIKHKELELARGGTILDDTEKTPVENHDDEALLTPSEVAAMFRVNPKTVTRWARSGKISAIRTLGGHRRFRASEIRQALAQTDEAVQP